MLLKKNKSISLLSLDRYLRLFSKQSFFVCWCLHHLISTVYIRTLHMFKETFISTKNTCRNLNKCPLSKRKQECFLFGTFRWKRNNFQFVYEFKFDDLQLTQKLQILLQKSMYLPISSGSTRHMFDATVNNSWQSIRTVNAKRTCSLCLMIVVSLTHAFITCLIVFVLFSCSSHLHDFKHLEPSISRAHDFIWMSWLLLSLYAIN